MPSLDDPNDFFADMFATPAMRALFSTEAMIEAYLAVEAALARAQSRVGVIPAEAGALITTAAKKECIDFVRLKKDNEFVGHPVLPLVEQLAEAAGEWGAYVHWGATTQDIMDTGDVLQLQEALILIERDLSAYVQALQDLAGKYQHTVMIGRTNGMQALPITFGGKIAVWIEECRRHQQRFQELRPRLLRVQCAGAVGTQAALGDSAEAVHNALAEELGLASANIPWHTSRDALAEYVHLCCMLGASLGRFAQEISLLSRMEIGEVSEPYVPGRGASSTMPHKRNPITCDVITALAKELSGAMGPMYMAMMAGHERSSDCRHVEWSLLGTVSLKIAASLHQSHTLMSGLQVFPEAMEKNLAMSNGLIMAESVMMKLAEMIGRQDAHDLVSSACRLAHAKGQTLKEVLMSQSVVREHLSEADLDICLAPASYTGLSAVYVDRVLA